MKLRDYIGQITVRANAQASGKQARQLFLGLASLLGGSRAIAEDRISGVAAVGEFVEAEAASWIDPDQISEARDHVQGFDACDLRHWLEIARRCDVPHVPARTILSLSEEQYGAACGTVALPDHVNSGLRRRLSRFLGEAEQTAAPQRTDPADAPDRGTVMGLAFAAMDDIPETWMVRSNISGSSMLKSLAGTGLLRDGRDGVTLAPDMSVGAGWVQHGNRRRVDLADRRFIETHASGHKNDIHFLARPWMMPARFNEGEDPHRARSPLAGSGRWPSEWRVFVEGGKVTGVANYYGWCGEADAVSTARALEAADLAGRIVEEVAGLSLAPRFMDIEILREMRGERSDQVRKSDVEQTDAQIRADREVQVLLARFGRDDIACTLDFIETTEGMMLLEAGPPHTPLGGGHPAAFAGYLVTDPSTDRESRCIGVALRCMEHVDLGNPSSWVHGDHPAILSFDEARQLAFDADSPSP